MAGRKKGDKPNDALAREREARAWEMRQKGATQRRIAVELGIDHSAVSRILHRIQARVLKELSERVEEEKVHQSDVLDHLVDEALQAWERSKQPEKIQTQKTVGGKTGVKKDGTKEAVESEESMTSQLRSKAGDPVFIDKALAALAEKRKVWGMGDAKNQLPPQMAAGDMSMDRFVQMYQALKAAGSPPSPPPEGTPEGTPRFVQMYQALKAAGSPPSPPPEGTP